MFSGLPPVALCACLRCHSKDKVWGKTDCTCTCDLAFRGGLAFSTRAVATRMKDRSTETLEKEALEIFERMDKMGEFPALSFDQVKSQALGFVYGLGVVVVLAVAGELSKVESFQNIGLAGLGLTTLRSTASFVTLFFTQRNSGGR